jgi:transcriptional regulator with XRE-family HTH domain
MNDTIKHLRQARGFSRQELAKRAHVHPVSLSRIESGKIRPHLVTLEKLAKALKVSVAVLVS